MSKIYEVLDELLEQGFGKDNSNYTENPNPRAIHKRIEAKKDKAKKGKCADCGSTKNLEWSENKDGSYTRRCRSCHMKYDYKNGMRKGRK